MYVCMYIYIYICDWAKLEIHMICLRGPYASLRELTRVHVSAPSAYAELTPTYANLRPCMFQHRKDMVRLRGAYAHLRELTPVVLPAKRGTDKYMSLAF